MEGIKFIFLYWALRVWNASELSNSFFREIHKYLIQVQDLKESLEATQKNI